ncbi:endolytic transglycosylase MltG [Nocardioides campestrisoli]|uniref:endolytic transglycosylase MltG n=1 Tax=Nocardioides campestrisoli TaxID=2736757 RepID=UPI00163DA13C|nr:endolytic transglycosylase MltG [Nocardioides campestrisoli]
MSEHTDADYEETEERTYGASGGARRKKRRRSPVGCLVALVVVAALAAGLYVGAQKGIEFVSDQFGSVEDYPGPGQGSVMFEVSPGDVAAQIGRNLKDAGVVASVQAFIDAAAANPDSSRIQPGSYELAEEMRAVDALDILLDPANQVKNTVTIPEGLRVTDIVDVLVEETDFNRKRYEKALADPAALGLPDYAEGNAEGYLFPATYEIGPKDKPKDILAAMVRRWRQAADEVGLEERAAALGKTPAEIMIIASLVEAEGRGDDMPKVARVIYNRLDGPGDKGGTNGLLQIDAANAYGIGKSGTTALTTEELAEDTPYNTRLYPGLPPTPVEAPGDDAIAAAVEPAEGPWYYYVTVDLATGETKFTDSYDEFLEFKQEYLTYCESSDAC